MAAAECPIGWSRRPALGQAGLPEYVIAFDLLDAGYRQWPSAAFGLIFVAVGSVLVGFREKTQAPSWFRNAFAFFFLGFSILWTTVAFVGTYGQYHSLSRALREGRVETVEGRVEAFVPMPYSGHAMESFSVGGVRFEYSDYVTTAGFNNTASHGGPIAPGQVVRIAYVAGNIVRLEIRK